ncbi:MAG: gamma-glutamyl-gamma-aminobutyrate hydrolase family protein [Rikenellaceae bacterium]
MSKKPIIGVIPLWDSDKNSIWMLPGYMDAVRESGGVPIIFPLVASRGDIEQVCGVCDGFLLTGGHDVDPILYGESKSEKCGEPNKERDALEREVFDYAMRNDIPVLGICRGIQLINALCGGTLYQDIPSELDSISHQMIPPYDQVWHKVRIVEGTPLRDIIGSKEIGVNSYHHQAIKSLAPSLIATAIAEDGLIEGVYMPHKRFLHAVQWHPEFNFHSSESSRKIVTSFINATKNNRYGTLYNQQRLPESRNQ